MAGETTKVCWQKPCRATRAYTPGNDTTDSRERELHGQACGSLNRATARRTPPPPLPNSPERCIAAVPGVAIGAGAAAYPARQRTRRAAPQYVWAALATAAPLAGQSCPPQE